MRHTLYTMMAASAALLLASAAQAQDETVEKPVVQTVDSTLYMKAFEMVSNGNPEDGRDLIDSLLKTSKEGTPKYAEGLYWRARLAAMGPKAERDYRQIIVDYTFTSRAPDALLRLGQLELTRGDRDAAEQRFQRIISEYPSSSVYAEANYWLARSYFDMNRTARACKVNAEALAKVSENNIELKNQIDFQNQQCRGLKVASVDSVETDVEEHAAKPAKKMTAAEKAAAAKAAKAKAAKAAKATKSVKEIPVTEPASEDSESNEAMAPDSAASKADAADDTAMNDAGDGEAPPAKKPATKATTKTAEKAGAKPAVKGAAKVATKSVPAAEKVTGKASEKAEAPATGKAIYMVQIAAYQTKAQAEEMSESLKQRGYTAHVDGAKAPFRVRIGRFTTRAGAMDLLAKLRANQVAMDAFVTQD